MNRQPFRGSIWAPPLAAFLFLCRLLAPTAPAAAAEHPAYLALGDSIAFGLGVPDPQSQGYVALAYQALRDSDRYRESGLDLVNLATPGATSSDLLEEGGQLDRALGEIAARAATPEEDAVEIVSLNIGGNDLLALARPASPCVRDAGSEECLAEFGATLSTLQANVTEVLSRLSEAAPEAGIFVINLYNPYSGTGDPREGVADLAVQQLNGVLGAAAAAQGGRVRLADVYQLFNGRGPQWISSDGLHPNENGHRVIAEVLVAAIDGRPPLIPADVLGTAAASPAGGEGAAAPGSNSGDSGTLVALLIAVPLAFAAGALTSGVYFLARGRR